MMSRPGIVHYVVTYASSDEDWAEWIAWAIEDIFNLEVFMPKWERERGSNFTARLQQALRDPALIILVLDKGSVEDVMIRQIIEGRTEFVLLINCGTRMLTMDTELGRRPMIDLNGLDSDQAYEVLAAGFRTFLEILSKQS